MIIEVHRISVFFINKNSLRKPRADSNAKRNFDAVNITDIFAKENRVGRSPIQNLLGLVVHPGQSIDQESLLDASQVRGFGKCCRSSPLQFSFSPHSHEFEAVGIQAWQGRLTLFVSSNYFSVSSGSNFCGRRNANGSKLACIALACRTCVEKGQFAGRT